MKLTGSLKTITVKVSRENDFYDTACNDDGETELIQLITKSDIHKKRKNDLGNIIGRVSQSITIRFPGCYLRATRLYIKREC